MRFVKILLILVAVVLLLPVIGLIVLSFIDLNNFKPMIAQQVEDATGRKLQIDGDINLGISLQPTFEVEGVKFANAPWGEAPNLAEVNQLDVKADLMPLLGGNIVIDHIIMVEPRIYLETNVAGEPNWELAPGDAASSAEPSPDEGGPGDGATLPLVKRIEIERAEIRYLDGTTGRRNELLLDAVTLLAEDMDAPVRLAVEGTLDGSGIDIAGETGSLNQVLASGTALPVDLNAQALGIVAAVTGSIAEPQAAKGIDLVVTASAENFAGLNPFVAGQDLPVDLAEFGPFNFAAKISGDADQLTIGELDLSLDALGAALRAGGSLGVAGGAADAGIDVSLTADDMSRLAAALEAPIPNQPLSLTASIAGNPSERITLSPIDFSFGPNAANGSAAIDLTGARPKIDADLQGEQIDVAVFAGPAGGSETAPAAEAAPGGRLFPDDPLPLDGLRAVDADVAVKLGRLITPAVSLNDLDLSLTLNDGKLLVEPLTFGLAGGESAISLAMGEQNGALDLDLALNSNALDMGALLNELDVTDLFEGAGDIAVDITANGGSVAALAGSLDGTITALMGKGRIRSAILDQWIDGLSSAVDTIFQNSDDQWIVLECLALDLAAADGVINPKGTVLNADIAVVTAEGAIDLGAETMAMTVFPQSKAAGLNLALPIGLDGPLQAPGFGLQAADATRQLQSLTGGAEQTNEVSTPLAALGATNDHPCVNPAFASSGNADLQAIIEDPTKALENLTQEPEKALDALKENPEEAIDAGKNLLRGILGGN